LKPAREWKTVCIKDGIQSAAKAVTQNDERYSRQQFNTLINNDFLFSLRAFPGV